MFRTSSHLLSVYTAGFISLCGPVQAKLRCYCRLSEDLGSLTCQLIPHQLDDRLSVHQLPQSVSRQDQELVSGSDPVSCDFRLGGQVRWGQIVWRRCPDSLADRRQDIRSCFVDSAQHLWAPFEADVAKCPKGQQQTQQAVMADHRPPLRRRVFSQNPLQLVWVLRVVVIGEADR